MTDTHPTRSRIVGTLAVLVIASLSTYFIPGGWKWVFEMVRNAISWLGSSSNIPTWFLILLCLLSLAFVATMAVLIFASLKANPQIDFTEKIFFGIRWRWEYGQYGICNLAAFCPDCDLQVHAKPAQGGGWKQAVLYLCDDCNRTLQEFDCSRSEVEDRVMRKIQQALREKRKQGNEHAD